MPHNNQNKKPSSVFQKVGLMCYWTDSPYPIDRLYPLSGKPRLKVGTIHEPAVQSLPLHVHEGLSTPKSAKQWVECCFVGEWKDKAPVGDQDNPLEWLTKSIR